MPDAPNMGSNTRSKPAGVGNQVAELDRLGLLPTPSAVDGSGGSMQQSLESLREGRRQRHLTDLPRMLDLEVGDDPLLLPTPTTGYSGRDPEKWRRERKPSNVGNERKITDLQVAMIEMESEPELLPTPTSSQGRNETSGRQPGSRHNTGTTLNDVVFKGDIASEPGALLPTPRTSDSKGTNSPAERERKSPGLGAIHYHLTGETPDRPQDEELMGTPQARDWKGVPGKNFNTHNLARDIDEMIRETGQAPLLPTPTTLDSREKRTTHAGGNPTLQGALCGTNPVDAERLGLEVAEPLLPTPNATDHMCGSTSLQGRIDSGRQVMLPHVVRDLPLLPTPVVNDMGAGKTPEQWDEWTEKLKARGYNGNGHGRSLSVEVQRGGEGVPLLPTPQTRDATGGKPEAVNRGRGYGADLNDVAAAGLLDQDENPLLPTPKTAEKRTSRRAVMDTASRSGPSIGQALEIAQGVLPQEFSSWEELPPSWQPGDDADAPPEPPDPLEGVVIDPAQAQIISLLETVISLLRGGQP